MRDLKRKRSAKEGSGEEGSDGGTSRSKKHAKTNKQRDEEEGEARLRQMVEDSG